MKTILCMAFYALLALAGYSQQPYLNAGLNSTFTGLHEQKANTDEFPLAHAIPSFLHDKLNEAPDKAAAHQTEDAGIPTRGFIFNDASLKMSTAAFTEQFDNQYLKTFPLRFTLGKSVSEILK
jgi:hypothetical protein